MSGVIKAIGKTFKAVVVRPLTHPLDIGKNISGAFHAIKHELVTGWHNKIVRYAAIAVAAYFTAGAAMAYFGSAAAGGASAAAAAGAGADSTIGIMAGATSASTAAAGLGGFGVLGTAGAAASTSALGLGAGALGADIATAGGSYLASGSLAAFTGQAVGASALSSGADASTISQSTGLASMPTGTSGSVMNDVATQASNPTMYTAGQGSALTDSSGLTQMGGVANPLGTSSYDLATAGTGVGDTASTGTGFWGSIKSGVSNLWDKMTGAGTTTTAGTTVPGTAESGGLLGSYGKMALIQGGLQMASSLLQKPQAQMQYSGVNSKGQGAGLGIHTTNSGFGLATGGSEAAPGGVPDALKPGSTAGAYNGAGLSNAAVSGSNQSQPGNLAQTVANSAGIGGLVPQGAVNYMGNSNG